MSFTARTQPFSARAQSVAAHAQTFATRTQAKLSDLNQGDGVRTDRPSKTETRQLLAILAGTVAFVFIVLALGVLGLMAR